MFKAFDRLIFRCMQKHLHAKRTHIVKQAVEAFAKRHPLSPEDEQDLMNKMEVEADRIYAICDRSILKERIQRSKYIFWVSAITSVILVAVVAGLTAGVGLALLVPPMTALVAWLVAMGTIPISYNLRVMGSMDAIIAAFEKSMLDRGQSQMVLEATEINASMIPVLVSEVNKRIGEINQKIKEVQDLQAKLVKFAAASDVNSQQPAAFLANQANKHWQMWQQPRQVAALPAESVSIRPKYY